MLGETAHREILANLYSILKPFVLRRLKQDVEEGLPPKREIIIPCAMTPFQVTIYQAILKGELGEYFARFERKKEVVKTKPDYREPDTDDEFAANEEAEVEEEAEESEVVVVSKSLQNQLMQLRKVCNHPYLFLHPSNGSEYAAQLTEQAGKLQLLKRMIPMLIKGGHRMLIFSQMARMLDLLQEFVEAHGWPHCRLDGSKSQPERVKEVKT